MSKFTPGPWEYQERSDDYTHIVRGPHERFIVQLAQDTSGVAEANARLIAAAPEMYDLLLAVVTGPYPLNDTLNKAQHLLKKIDRED